jgi:hypothetical protein
MPLGEDASIPYRMCFLASYYLQKVLVIGCLQQ